MRGGHAQTIGGRYLPARPVRLESVEHFIEIGDEESLSVFESTPVGWRVERPAALLLHGLAGCARSPYVERIAERLVKKGVRAVRVNMRGAGSGFGRAKGFYHAGRTEDVAKVLEWLNLRCPGSPIAVIGFSLGANLALRLSGEATRSRPSHSLDCVVAANPPIDLRASCLYLRRAAGRPYDRHFIGMLRKDVTRLHSLFPDLGQLDWTKIRSVYDFDDAYTAPRNGFENAEDYYARCSSAPIIRDIELPGLVVHAEDDPFIPVKAFHTTVFPPNLTLELLPTGGHLGYISRRPVDSDRRWLDARIVAWLSEHWGLTEDSSHD
ncbi:MAG: alpha/beta fold hydrolase [Isosphaeraceae bacterium]